MDSNKKLFEYFKGNWKFERELYSSERKIGTAEGKVIFKVNDEDEDIQHKSLRYIEKGELRLEQGKSTTVISKEYEYVLENNDEFSVYFVESNGLKGKFFHKINLINESEADGSHLCEKDLYQAKYKIDNEQNFSITFKVDGPTKDHIYQSHLHRIP